MLTLNGPSHFMPFLSSEPYKGKIVIFALTLIFDASIPHFRLSALK